jgi:hypothetical protein
MDTETGQVFEATPEQLRIVRETLSPADAERFVELPAKPNSGCRKCKGRGTRKSWGTPYAYGACPICYPDHPQKARSFSTDVRSPRGGEVGHE